jgi:hypothetical protein
MYGEAMVRILRCIHVTIVVVEKAINFKYLECVSTDLVIQDPSHSNADNLNNVRSVASRYFRNKQKA